MVNKYFRFYPPLNNKDIQPLNISIVVSETLDVDSEYGQHISDCTPPHANTTSHHTATQHNIAHHITHTQLFTNTLHSKTT